MGETDSIEDDVQSYRSSDDHTAHDSHSLDDANNDFIDPESLNRLTADDDTFSPSPQLHRSEDVRYSGGDLPASKRPSKAGQDDVSPHTSNSDKLDEKGRARDGASEPEGVCRMQKYTLYETATRYYIVGADLTEMRYRMLKIDRTVDAGELSIIEDDIVYSKDQLSQLLAAIEDGNLAHGGLKLRSAMWGILGFLRFTGSYYLLVITKKSIVAMIGGHYIYQIESTELVPITSGISTKKADKNPEEARFMSILGNLDLTRNFYFSYSYDITRTLQYNLSRAREALHQGLSPAMTTSEDYNEMFAWNHYLLQPAMEFITNTFDWCLPLLHGFIDQSKISVLGRPVYVTLIARRSRYFAGARFLKRGANDLGYVANDVETEQIVCDMITTSFHAPGGKLYGSPHYTSYVQHRGSIPLYWSQESSPSVPKPPITLNLVDPFFTAAAMHFDQLFDRYGIPIIVLNLIKAREKIPRESLLLHEFTQSITYLNQLLPKDSQIRYIAWDMSRASKSRGQDVVEKLEAIADKVVAATGIFHNGYDDSHPAELQNGVCRTNCIDCLDRTNAAQFVIGKRALGLQLKALGIIDDSGVDYDTDAINLFTHMYHDHGDSIALQYGGSHLVNTMETYRKINQWSSHSRDMIESFKRYYNNSFLDAQRQEAINLFLGNYIFAKGQPMLWDLETDYYLHHADPRAIKKKRSYVKWWTPDHLIKKEMPSVVSIAELEGKPLTFYDEYWLEYYKPRALSTFPKIFSFKMNSTVRKIPENVKWDPSPFTARSGNPNAAPRKELNAVKRRRSKSVKIVEPSEFTKPFKRLGLQRWLTDPTGEAIRQANLGESIAAAGPFKLEKETVVPQPWTMEQTVYHSMNPSVSKSEKAEYERYVTHPLNLPIVPYDDIPNPPSVLVSYVKSSTSIAVAELESKIEDEAVYQGFVDSADNYIAGFEDSAAKMRYKAYHSYVAGKGFKQQRMENILKLV